MKRMLLVLLAVMLLGGCATPLHWTKENLDPQQLEKDDYECELQRAQYEGSHPDLGTGIAGWQFYKRCMQIRGYALKKH